MPAGAPAPIDVDVHTSVPGAGCTRGTSDGSGHVAIQNGNDERGQRWQVYTADATARQSFAGNAPLFPQPEGWQVAYDEHPGAANHQVDVRAFSPDGGQLQDHAATEPPADRSLGSWTTSEDPEGGTAVASAGQAMGGNHPCYGTLYRFDASGAPRASPARFGVSGNCLPVGVAVSNAGEALVVEVDMGTAWLWWLNVDGSLARGPISAGEAGGPRGVFTRNAAIALHPLLDGSIVASEGGVWTRRFPRLGERAEDAPTWLAARAGWSYRFTRGNRGYAMFPPQSQELASCSPAIELHARSGRVCGTVTLRVSGDACRTGSLDQGWDGTVVAQAAEGSCRFRWWPRLLAGD